MAKAPLPYLGFTILSGLLLISPGAHSATVPNGFTDEVFEDGLTNPTAMEFAPDGRLFVAEQGGTLLVIKDGVLLPTPFVSLSVDSSGERGLLGVTFDPNFSSNQFVYVYYTVPGSPAHNRVMRFTANGDVAQAGSEQVILELPNLSTARNHNGGAIHFGTDGKLYIAVGDNGNGSNAQLLSIRLGKMLRINADGTIPADNPTSFPGIPGTPSGVNRAIWAVGLRNPFTFAIQRTTGKLFINDVGKSTWEEINKGLRGKNYGWPATEGPTTNPDFTSPIYVYPHGGPLPSGCAITGGAFYNPPTVQFPSFYVGKYFFADFCGDWIYLIDSANPSTATPFATGISAPVDLKVSAGGELFYLARGTDSVGRIRYTGETTQSILVSTNTLNVTEGESIPLTVKLAKQPPSTATVAITRLLSDPSVSVFPTSLIFTSTDWNTPKTVTVTAGQDGDTSDDGATIVFSSTGLASQRVVVRAVDNDRPPSSPQAIISLPRNGDVVLGVNAEFFGDGLDNGQVVRAKFYIDGIRRYTDVNSTGHYHYKGDHNSWNTTGLSNGTHVLRMQVFDNEGLTASHKITVIIAN